MERSEQVSTVDFDRTREFNMGLNWEHLGKEPLPPGGLFPWSVETWRARVPGGWLVLCIKDGGDQTSTGGVTFVPDPGHAWDGNALPVQMWNS
jgi:hypothetical protein